MNNVLLLAGGRGCSRFFGRLGVGHALVFLVVGDDLVLGLVQHLGVLGFRRRRFFRLGGFFRIGFRRRLGQGGLHRGKGAEAQPGGERDRDRELSHGCVPPQCCVCAETSAAVPVFAATLPDLTSSYQYWWCSLAQVSSV